MKYYGEEVPQQSIPSFSTIRETMTEYEVAKIAFKIYESQDMLEYDECVNRVKEAHGISNETGELRQKIASLETTNDLLKVWIKVVSDPVALEKKRKEFKEFLASIHMQEEGSE